MDNSKFSPIQGFATFADFFAEYWVFKRHIDISDNTEYAFVTYSAKDWVSGQSVEKIDDDVIKFNMCLKSWD